jgi:hypothetical protein
MQNQNFKLGLNPSPKNAPRLKLSNYIRLPLSVLPMPARRMRLSDRVSDYPMYLNDAIGDCAIAGPAHMIQTWSANLGREIRVSDADVLKAYSDVSGYKPGRPDTDTGCNLIEVLNYWKNVGIGGHKITAFVQVDFNNILELQLAQWWFGGTLWAIDLPLSAQNSHRWRVPDQGFSDGRNAVGSWGGHCTTTPDHDDAGLDNVTWGGLLGMDYQFVMRPGCGAECWAVLSPDWIDARGISPTGFALADLLTDMQIVGQMADQG